MYSQRSNKVVHDTEVMDSTASLIQLLHMVEGCSLCRIALRHACIIYGVMRKIKHR